VIGLHNEDDNVKDVYWENINEAKLGEIKFRKRQNNIKSIFRGIAFMLIAIISGAVSSSYIVEKKYSEIMKDKAKTETQSGENVQIGLATPTSDAYGNEIGKVSELVGPTVVGIVNSLTDDINEVNGASGSGIIFDANGYIVTNYHVIESAKSIFVKLANGRNYLKAEIIGSDPTSDLAIIKIEAANLPIAKFGDSSKVKVGDLAIAIGNPLGEEFAGTVTAGIISARDRKIRYGGSVYKVLQTDAAINPGNSGGALSNSVGEVIGINSLKLGDGQFQNVEGMGFAIAINEAITIIDEIMKYGRVARPRLGIYGRDAVSIDGSGVKGVYVSEIIKGSGAEKSGVKPTDIIVELDGKAITKFEDITEIIEKHKIGDTIKCKIWRSGKTIDLSILLADIKETE
jgi:serine protease Do